MDCTVLSQLILCQHHIPLAMARVKLMKNVVTSRRQPHSPLDNVQTPYNPIRYHRDNELVILMYMVHTQQNIILPKITVLFWTKTTM